MATVNETITAIPGIRVGHAQDLEALTGCTVILCEAGAVGGVDQRGGAPGTRQTDALRPMHLVDRVHGIVLTGGSAFGLDTATGVMRYLEERGVGFDVRVARVPIVPTAVLFDLGLGSTRRRPDAAMGYAACLSATTDPVPEGCVGAGTGATVGKVRGIAWAMKSGLGTCCYNLGGVRVGAIMAVNAWGDVIDPNTGQILAGARRPDGGFADALEVLRELARGPELRFGGPPQPGDLSKTTPEGGSGAEGVAEQPLPPSQHTVIGVVATNTRLTRDQANKMAQMAHDGLARVVRPAHTMLDGDTIFALGTGDSPDAPLADINIIGAFAAEATAQAIVRAVRAAVPAGGLPAISEL